MTATLHILRDGPDLVAGFTFPGHAPEGFAAFGYRTLTGEPAWVWVRCLAGDLMPLRGAIDWLQDHDHGVTGISDYFRRRLGLAG